MRIATGSDARLIMLSGAAVLSASTAVLGADRFVDANSPQDGTGTNWSNAYHQLATALNATPALQSGDRVFVAGGVYKPHASSQSVSFQLKSGVSIQGGYRGYNTQSIDPDERVEESILSGDLSGNDTPGTSSTYTDNAYIVVFVPNGVQPPSQSALNFADRANLDGFSITAGHGGGGIRTNATVSPAASVVIRNCKIHNNRARPGFGLPGDGEGGGVWIGDGASILFRMCEIYENRSDYEAGGIGVGGVATFLNCSIHDNISGFDGGGIRCVHNTDKVVTIVSSTIANNIAGLLPSGQFTVASGGAIASSVGGTVGTLRLVNSTLVGNTATLRGGALRVASAQLAMTNCTVSANTATGIFATSGTGGGLSINPTAGDFITNSIFWDNSATNSPEIAGGGSTLSVTYSDVEQSSGTYSGTGNINSPPNFVGGGNYRLGCGTLCIDAGDDNAVVADSFDVDENDILGTEDAADRAIRPRIGHSSVDMGACERHNCTADVDQNGRIDIDDLLLVINSWGTPCTGSCAGDIHPSVCGGNGSVDIDDLLLVINAWGNTYTTCEDVGFQDVGELASVDDCMDAATEKGMTPWTEEWIATVDGCARALCEAQILMCD